MKIVTFRTKQIIWAICISGVFSSCGTTQNKSGSNVPSESTAQPQGAQTRGHSASNEAGDDSLDVADFSPNGSAPFEQPGPSGNARSNFQRPPASILNKNGPAQLWGGSANNSAASNGRKPPSAKRNDPVQNQSSSFRLNEPSDGTNSADGANSNDAVGASLGTNMPSSFVLVPQKGHTRWISSVDYSRDGNFVVTCALDGTARLWDTRNGIMVRVFEAPESRVRTVKFMDADKKIVTCDDRGSITVFDRASGKQLSRTSLGYLSWATWIHPLNDGKHLIVSHKNEKVFKVDAFGGQSTTLFYPCNDKSKVRVNASLSPDETMMAFVCNDGEAKLYDVRTQRHLKSIRLPVKDEHKIQFLADNRRVLIVYAGGNVHKKRNGGYVWDTHTNEIKSSFKTQKNIRSVSVSNDSKLVALNINVDVTDAEIEVRKIDDGKLVSRIDKFVVGDEFVRFSPDDKKIVAPGDLSSVGIFDIQTTKRIRQLSTEDSGGIESISTHPTSWKVATSSGDGNVYLWNLATLSLERMFDANVENITSMAYSSDGKYIATSELTNPSETVKSSYTSKHMWNAMSGQKIFSKIYQKDSNRVAAFSPSSEIAIVSGRHKIYVLNTRTQKTISTIKHENSSVHSVSFNDDETNVLLFSDYEKDAIYDVASGKRIREITLSRAKYGYYLSNNRLLLVTDLGDIYLWDAQRDKQIEVWANRDIYSENRATGILTLRSDKRKAIGFLKTGEIGIWDLRTGRVTNRIKRTSQNETAVNFLPHEDYVIVGDTHGALKILNISTGQHISLIANATEWIAYTEDGYFDASKGGGKLVAVVSGNDSYRIDQMAIKNNRPDLVFSKIGLGSAELIEHYKSLYLQRIRKIEVSEDSLSTAFETAPTAKILSSTKQGDNAVIRFRISDNAEQLTRYNIYVNDVPIFGATGKRTSGHSRTLTETVVLTDGENKIELGALNQSGVESLRPNIVIPHKKNAQGSLYYLAFGISNYADPQLSLKYAAKDAFDLETLLKTTQRNYKHVFSKVFTDSQVTPSAIKKSKTFFQDATVDDTVVLFVAGHGLYVSGHKYTYYYLTHNTELSNIEKTAAPFELLEDLLQGIAPRKKLFLIDTCQSGEQGGAVVQTTLSALNSRGLISRGIRKKVFDKFGIPKDQFLYADRNRFIYNDIFRSSGAIVLSSSRGVELSYESDKLKNGIFTEQVLEALSSRKADKNKDNQISTAELQEYVAKEVSTATMGLQNPVVDRDNLEIKFGFPIGKSVTD